jgi:hypothetical protein
VFTGDRRLESSEVWILCHWCAAEQAQSIECSARRHETAGHGYTRTRRTPYRHNTTLHRTRRPAVDRSGDRTAHLWRPADAMLTRQRVSLWRRLTVRRESTSIVIAHFRSGSRRPGFPVHGDHAIDLYYYSTIGTY